MSTALRALVLVAAAYVGLGAPQRHLRAARSPFTFDVASKADVVYAAAAPHVRPGERLGVFVPGQNETAGMTAWYSAQYALAPAIVVPLYADACFQTGPGPRCRLPDVDRVVAPRDPRALQTLDARLGLAPVAPAGELVFLARRAR